MPDVDQSNLALAHMELGRSLALEGKLAAARKEFIISGQLGHAPGAEAVATIDKAQIRQAQEEKVRILQAAADDQVQSQSVSKREEALQQAATKATTTPARGQLFGLTFNAVATDIQLEAAAEAILKCRTWNYAISKSIDSSTKGTLYRYRCSTFGMQILDETVRVLVTEGKVARISHDQSPPGIKQCDQLKSGLQSFQVEYQGGKGWTRLATRNYSEDGRFRPHSNRWDTYQNGIIYHHAFEWDKEYYGQDNTGCGNLWGPPSFHILHVWMITPWKGTEPPGVEL